MARPKSQTLTERESQIMEILWELGSATSEQVRAQLPGDPHDSSVRTLLRVLITKKLVKTAANSRPSEYRAAVQKDKVQKNAVKVLVERLFGGSAEALVVRLVEDNQLTVEQLEELNNSLNNPSTKSNIKSKQSKTQE